MTDLLWPGGAPGLQLQRAREAAPAHLRAHLICSQLTVMLGPESVSPGLDARLDTHQSLIQHTYTEAPNGT